MGALGPKEGKDMCKRGALNGRMMAAKRGALNPNTGVGRVG